MYNKKQLFSMDIVNLARLPIQGIVENQTKSRKEPSGLTHFWTLLFVYKFNLIN